MVKGHGVRYYAERSKGDWYAFQVFIPSGLDSRQQVALEFRIYRKSLSEQSHKWPLEIVYRSATLWSMPFATLWWETIQVLYRLADIPTNIIDEDGVLQLKSRVSRIDVAIDTDEIQFTEEDRGRFVTRARHRAAYSTEEWVEESPDETNEEDTTAIYHRGEEFTGLTFGKGSILVRIYNKWIEVSKSGSYKHAKLFFSDIWKEAGWDTTKDVWRIECQLRREALHALTLEDKTFADASIPAAVKHFPSIFPYLYGSWLTFHDPTNDNNKSKWPMNEVWQNLVEKATAHHSISERRNLPIQFDAVSLAKSLLGLLSSFAVAIGESSSSNLFRQLDNYIGQTLQIDDLNFRMEQAIQDKSFEHGILLAKERM